MKTLKKSPAIIFPALLLTVACVLVPNFSFAQAKKPPMGIKKETVSKDFGKLPTYIKSDTLTVRGNDRTFLYEKNVEVKQGDMTLTCDTLEGTYTEENRIKTITALGDVNMTKGDTIRASGRKAIYDDSTQIVTFTDSPELQQDGSVLTADIIKVFLQENRATAEGTVRVKVVKKEGMTEPSQLFSGVKK